MKAKPVCPIRPCECDTAGVIKAVWGVNTPSTHGEFRERVDSFNLRIFKAESLAFEKGVNKGMQNMLGACLFLSLIILLLTLRNRANDDI